MQRRVTQTAIAVALVAMASGGCASTRFSPPTVNLDHPSTAKTVGASCSAKVAQDSQRIAEDFQGAMQLIDNFMVGYRCAAKSAADGRTKFEVPTFLLATAAAVGQSFGISEDGTLGLVTGAAVARQGNSYFAPQAKADYLNSAIDALTCIQLESVGIDGFDLSREQAKADDAPQGDGVTVQSEVIKRTFGNTAAWAALPSGATAFSRDQLKSSGFSEDQIAKLVEASKPPTTVQVSAEQQYFRMISGALLSVERVLARRLNHAGTPFDPAGIVAEISMLTQETEGNNPPDANDNKDGAGDGQPSGTPMSTRAMLQTLQAEKLKLTVDPDLTAQKAARLKKIDGRIETLEVKLLQPKLQKCIILAKI